MPTIQVLDPAVVPELPVGRGTVRKGMLAGVAAFMFGIFLVFSREYVVQAICYDMLRIGPISSQEASVFSR